jgi:hypothetical protein
VRCSSFPVSRYVHGVDGVVENLSVKDLFLDIAKIRGLQKANFTNTKCRPRFGKFHKKFGLRKGTISAVDLTSPPVLNRNAAGMLLKLRLSKAVGALSAMRISAHFKLLLLPDELISLIVDYLDDSKTLRNLARSCRRIQEIAEHKLYRALLIRSGPKTKAIKRSFSNRLGRARALLYLECPLKNDEPQSFDSLDHILRSATRLREIMFESPACNSSDFEDSVAWEHMTRHIFSPFQEAALDVGKHLVVPPLQQLRKGE